MQLQVKLKCKPNVLEIYSYLVYYSFHSVAGVVRIGISMLFLAAACFAAGQVETILVALLIAVGLLNPVVTPVVLYIRAVHMEKREDWMTYELDEERVVVSQKGVHRRIPWSAFPLIVWERRVLVLYVDENHALLLPKRQMEDKDAVYRILCGLPDGGNVRLGKRKGAAG